MSELMWLRGHLVEPGLLPAGRLDGWLVGWAPEKPLLRHLVERGVLDQGAAGTLSAVIKGYVRVEPATLVGLFRVAVEDVSKDREDVPQDRVDVSKDRVDVSKDRGDVPKARLVAAAGEAERAVRGDMSGLGARWTGRGPEAVHSQAVRAAVDAALSATRPRSLPEVGGRVAGHRLLGRVGGETSEPMFRAIGAGGRALIKIRSDDGVLATQARAHARLVHPAIVRVLASGAAEGVSYLAFADPVGLTLAEYLELTGPLAARRVAQIGLDAAEALAAAAALGVSHGELGLGQVVVVRSDARVKLFDFAAPGDATQRASQRAPERAQGAPVSARSDMYSLGIVLHTALHGCPPPRKGVEPRTGRERALGLWIAKLLRAQPEARPRDWDEVVVGLREIAEDVAT